MTTQEQIKALAELDGWYLSPSRDMIDPNTGLLRAYPECWVKEQGESEDKLVWNDKDLPDYLTSYDTIIPLIQKQDWNTKCEVAIQIRIMKQKEYCSTMPCILPTMNNLEGWCIVTLLAPPQQLCEALLRATGKWIE